MDLFTVSLPDNLQGSINKLRMLLTEQADVDLHMADGSKLVAAGVKYHILQSQHIRCEAQLPQFRLNTDGPLLYRSAASAIAEYVISELESKMLSVIIKKKYRNNPSMDVSVIERYCYELLNGKEWDGLGNKFHEGDRNRRKNKISDELEKYLAEETELNIDGFITFRLLSYRNELTEIVEYALDEYVLDKQYQEFISLLKYFVQLQETKVPFVHLLHKGGHDFTIYNESFHLIEPKPPADRIVAEMLETEMNIEDMVISSLISLSPKQITVHTRHPELSVIRTIETIFDGRVKVCVQCSACTSTLDEWVQP
ncbi:putative sporulation protein YtxC [Paenibacillus sp. GSMTC-2017]|uniref:putative sporulation protein YtxC n=1 Tax=Paenibacillus sp. GSMTC-2017 TaxID=2794350 RepID=UPI0018D863A8|nr:putative sporulation protein YtxC [Paenibacillus sp. GSMTC-2017]MBH5319259.1 putative sporulation protein YtxC [Paenibacillus sp. GSMTC-2017]